MNSSTSTVYPESLETNGANDTLPGAKSTTIGTVVIRSGPIQMLIALLQSGDLYFIKVVEVEPKLTALGDNIDEAVGLQREHDELLKQLQNKSSPVEEFVLKADKLLAARKASPQILDAMGQTLNMVWEDILKLLHDRKHILDLCANFHEKMGSCRGKMASLEVACKDTMIPIEIEAVQEFLNKFKQLRIDVLTAVMSALKDGNELLARLQEIAQSGTLDSRPDHVRKDAMRAVNQVQQWLENLHDRRNMLEAAWQTRKSQLEQCLALAILAKDLDELEGVLMNQKNIISGVYSLGECEHTSSQYLQEYVGFKQDALLLRDKALKITRATEKLVASGCFAGDEACSRAYAVLSHCTEHFEQIDQREHWLHQSKDFFSKAEKTLSVLERLEIELSNLKIANDSPEAFSMYSKILKDLKAFTEESLRLGYAILDEVGRTKPETQGVKRVLDEIENRKIYLEGICSASTEQQVMVTQAITEFMEEYNELLSWLVSIAEAFLRTNNTIGTTLQQSKNFLHLHHKLMQDLERKGENINNLLTKIKQFLNSLDAQQRYDVDTKAESLHKHWIELKDIVFKRVDLVSIYIEFLEKAEKLSEMFEYIEKNLSEVPEEERLGQLESVWGDIKTAYGNLKAIGMRFLNIKVADPYLETKSACSSVEEILNSFSNRQFDITSSWEKWTTNIIEKREIQVLWEKIMNENIEILNQATKLDAQLYPVLTSPSSDPIDLRDHADQKLQSVLADIDRAQNEILERITTTSKIQTKDMELAQKIDQVTSNLQSIKNKLDNVKYDYKTLLEQMIDFLENVSATRHMIEKYFKEKQTAATDRAKVIRDLADHSVFRENTMDKFRLLNAQCEKLIDRVRVLEPQGARELDADRIISQLEKLRIYFETNYDQRMSELEKLHKITQFNEEIYEINSNLDKVGQQLQDIQEQQVETTASAKTTSLAFEYFERTTELLERRIDDFIRTSENIHTTYPDTKSHIDSEVEKLKQKWNSFKDQVKSTRSLLNLTNEYFHLLEEIDTEYRTISTFYTNTSNQIPYLQNPVEGSNLVNDIEKYIGPHEENQMKRLEKLKSLSKGLPGKDQITTKYYETNITLFTSYVKLRSDINVVVDRLKIEEKQRELKQRELKQFEENERLQKQKITEIQSKTEINEILETEIKYLSPIFTRPLKDTTIKEGEKITLDCQVVGSPEPTVEWFKDGISIQNNPDYRTTNDRGYCTLSIEETFADDSARFVCRASNLVGTIETTATLSVKEERQDRTEEMIPPKILKYLENGLAREGSSFQFSCVVSGNPLPTVQWFKNDVCIDDSHYYVITYNNGEATLKFEEVFLEDQAIYTCKVINPVGFEQCSAALNVEPLEPTELPSFTVPLSNAMARVGQKIKLECVVAGIPRPEVFWMQNGKPYVGREAKYENDRVTLIIPEAYPKDAGVYLVTAKNLAGEAYSTCNVSVKGRLPNETSDSEMASDMEPIKPSVQLPLKDVAIFEGKSVRLDCVIVGQPEPEVIWYHNQRPVKESADVQLLFQGDRCSLVIHEAYLEDAGSYKVVAINSAGEASSSCNLSVTPLNVAEPATRVQAERIVPIESPPKFEKFLTDVLAAEGDTVELECSVIGDASLTVKWYLSNKEVFESDRVKIINVPVGVFKLIISNVTADDKGVYTVKVSNSSGDAKCFSHLIVKSVNAPENQQRPLQLEQEEKFICPTFRELFSDKNAHPDEVVKFECIVVGKPTPKIKWLFNDQPVHGKHFLVSTSGDRQVLTIQSVCPETVGKIACVAENEIGKATCVAHLSLIGNGHDPSSNVNVQSMSEEHNTESSRVTIKKQMFTSTSTSQVSTVENGIPQTQIHGTVQRVDQDFNQIGDRKPEIIQSRQYQEYHKTNESPMAIQQKSIVVVTKPDDQEPQHKIVRKQIAPRFMSPLVGKIVDQGADVQLEAIYDGFPTPDIKVQKNGDDLVDSDRVKILNAFNKVTISLSSVGVRDAGRYSVVATNTAGSSTSTADVVVKKTIFPPVFGHRLQAQVAKRGERVIMDVEVTGTPEPTITWYKDNKPLAEVLKSEFRIKNQGNSHTLIIEKVQTIDSGKFMVKATNAGGEAQSIADFAVLEPTPERMVEVVKTVVYDDLKDFKAETSKPQSNSFHTKQTESSTESNVHGATESTIVTEHRCTTEATMRMEHKASFLDLPTLSKPGLKPPTPLLEIDQKTVSTNTDLSRTISDSTQTPPQVPPKPVATSMNENSSIESSSITKQSAYEFFKKIQTEPVPTEDKYTKYGDVSKPPMVPVITPQKTVTLNEDLIKLDLTPGAPPEYGFMPSARAGEHLTDRIKKLGESQKANFEIPSGGVQTLPQINKREEHSMYSKESTYEFSSGPIFRPQAALAAPNFSAERSQSPKPSAEGVAMEKLWSPLKPFEHETIQREQSELESRNRKQFSCTESDGEYQQPEESVRTQSIKETKQIFEEKIKMSSREEELKAPQLVKQFYTPSEPLQPIPEALLDLQLEPGTPPEICFAPKTTEDRRPSLVEVLEQTLQKEPSKVLPLSVRIIPPIKRDTIPPPLPPKDFHQTSVPLLPQKPYEIPIPPADVYRVPKPPPPTGPPKFIRGEFYESDYESDKWKYSESESDEPAYRSVKPAQFISRPQPLQTAGQPPLPPSMFETPGAIVQPEIPKPKPVSGYIADTEDSVFRKSEYHHQSTVQSSKKFYETHQPQPDSSPLKYYRHHHLSRNSYPEESVQCYPKDYSTSSFVKNISMTTKNVKEVTEGPQLEPFPYKAEPQKPRTVKVPPPPSPSKFMKGEFRESDYGSDYDERIQPIWRPYDSDSSELKGYRPIHPILTPTTGRRSTLSDGGKSPVAPMEFDNPPKFDGPPRPKFEPIKHEEPVKVQPQAHVYKPKPVSAKYVPTQQQPQPIPTTRPHYTTQYYTAVAGAPMHNASLATETKKTVQMKESSETCHRVVNMSQTHRVIHFDNQKSSQDTQLEPFPYTVSPSFSSPKPRVQLPPTPTKFVRGEFRDSDYENDVDSVRIRPVWTPNPSDNEEPQYRRVNPPRPTRSSSLPRSYERVITPMEFDTHPPELPTKIPVESSKSSYNQSYKSNTMQSYSSQKSYNTQTTRDDMNLKIGSPPKYNNYTSQVNNHIKDFGRTIQSKSTRFMDDVSKDLNSTHTTRPGFKRAPSEGDNKPHAYREESRVSQYGTKHIDPNTGLIYFKYDFGYEFGIIFPGEGKKIVGGTRNVSSLNESRGTNVTPMRHAGYQGDIIIPVQHERTASSSRSASRQNGFTSEGEISETEYDGHAKKRYSLPIDINIDHLHSADTNHFLTRKPVPEYATTVPVNLNREERPKRPPIFITPLKDIAVVIGQTARFECIAQCEPHPKITWSKNGFPLQHSNKHFIEFRNGVCRLTIPEAYPDDAATYTCTGTNELGSATSSAELLVPGNKCGVRY